MEPSEAPSIKRRKLNDGSGSVTNASTSPSCTSPNDLSDDGDILQPLPVHRMDSDKENAVPPALPPPQMIPQAPMQMPMRFMPQMPMQGMMPPGMQQQMQRFHPRYPMPPMNMMQHPNMYPGAMQFQQQKVEAIVLDKDESKSEELPDNEMPHSRL